MKKIILISIISLISCETKKEIDNCGCKFNLDAIMNKDNIEFEKYLKFYDKDTMDKCIVEYQKESENKDVTFEDIYNFYHKKCPNYNLDIKKE
jgi:hypothetical protein